MKRIIIFYKYVAVEHPDQEKKSMFDLCKSLNLKGRIILAHEGINGTVAGSMEETESFKTYLNEHALFFGMDIKDSLVDPAYEYFPKLQIKVKSEIVNLGIDANKLTPEHAGKHLTPDQVHELLQKNPDNLLILDARNDYEWQVGRFNNSILPDIQNFRELPSYIDKNIEQFKDKEVLMYCTAGVRCERASAYLNVKGVAQNVYQIEGGVQRYVEKYPDGFFRGTNYVFDNRITVKINDDILSVCLLCQKPCDEYVNCKNALCNNHFVGCDACIERLESSCSEACLQLIKENKVALRPPAEHLRQQKRIKALANRS